MLYFGLQFNTIPLLKLAQHLKSCLFKSMHFLTPAFFFPHLSFLFSLPSPHSWHFFFLKKLDQLSYRMSHILYLTTVCRFTCSSLPFPGFLYIVVTARCLIQFRFNLVKDYFIGNPVAMYFIVSYCIPSVCLVFLCQD